MFLLLFNCEKMFKGKKGTRCFECFVKYKQKFLIELAIISKVVFCLAPPLLSSLTMSVTHKKYFVSGGTDEVLRRLMQLLV